MSTVDAKIIEHIANSSNNSSISKDDVFNAVKVMYEITNSPPKEDVMTWKDGNLTIFKLSDAEEKIDVQLLSFNDTSILEFRTGLIWCIHDEINDKILKFVLICKDYDINQDLDNMTKDTPNNGTLVSLTNDLILPIWIGRSTRKEANNAIVIAADFELFRVHNSSTENVGIFEVSQMSTNTLMKIIENYNKPYNQCALLPE